MASSKGVRRVKVVGNKQIPICPNHQEEEVLFVCTNCSDQWACKLCVISCHKGHCFEPFETNIEKRKQYLREKIAYMENVALPSLQGQMGNLDEEIKRRKEHSANTKKAILNRGEVMKKELDKIARRYQRMCRQAMAENDSKLEVHKDHLENIYAEYMQEVSKFQQSVLNDVNNEIDESQIPKMREEPQYPDTTVTSFEPAAISRKQIAEMFGKLSIVNKDGERVEVECKLEDDETTEVENNADDLQENPSS